MYTVHGYTPSVLRHWALVAGALMARHDQLVCVLTWILVLMSSCICVQLSTADREDLATFVGRMHARGLLSTLIGRSHHHLTSRLAASISALCHGTFSQTSSSTYLEWSCGEKD